jgi:hypothetical protein
VLDRWPKVDEGSELWLNNEDLVGRALETGDGLRDGDVLLLSLDDVVGCRLSRGVGCPDDSRLGRFVGDEDGASVGFDEGLWLGKDGRDSVGRILGPWLGTTNGVCKGIVIGSLLGHSLDKVIASWLGWVVGFTGSSWLGLFVGEEDDASRGIGDGPWLRDDLLGTLLGSWLGTIDGPCDGTELSLFLGISPGDVDWCWLGMRVGFLVLLALGVDEDFSRGGSVGRINRDTVGSGLGDELLWSLDGDEAAVGIIGGALLGRDKTRLVGRPLGPMLRMVAGWFERSSIGSWLSNAGWLGRPLGLLSLSPDGNADNSLGVRLGAGSAVRTLTAGISVGSWFGRWIGSTGSAVGAKVLKVVGCRLNGVRDSKIGDDVGSQSDIIDVGSIEGGSGLPSDNDCLLGPKLGLCTGSSRSVRSNIGAGETGEQNREKDIPGGHVSSNPMPVADGDWLGKGDMSASPLICSFEETTKPGTSGITTSFTDSVIGKMSPDRAADSAAHPVNARVNTASKIKEE